MKPRKPGQYKVYGGCYYHPVLFGTLNILKADTPKKVSELTEQDAMDDGFDSLEKLRKELHRLKVGSDALVYKHWIEGVKKNETQNA